ncbi:hypothetical protein [Kribbella hippodromi]|uniref:hypothetical protein n=1 Tax=Kribbella hippodromi TaxID=434347 RepID=UPI0031CDB467
MTAILPADVLSDEAYADALSGGAYADLLSDEVASGGAGSGGAVAGGVGAGRWVGEGAFGGSLVRAEV